MLVEVFCFICLDFNWSVEFWCLVGCFKQTAKKSSCGRSQKHWDWLYRGTCRLVSRQAGSQRLTHVLLLVHVHVGGFALTWEQPRPHSTWRAEEQHQHGHMQRPWGLHLILLGCAQQQKLHTLHEASSHRGWNINIQRASDMGLERRSGLQHVTAGAAYCDFNIPPIRAHLQLLRYSAADMSR